jgi:hypothetical protein
MNGTAYGEERKEGVNAYQVLQAVITTPDCTLCNHVYEDTRAFGYRIGRHFSQIHENLQISRHARYIHNPNFWKIYDFILSYPHPAIPPPCLLSTPIQSLLHLTYHKPRTHPSQHSSTHVHPIIFKQTHRNMPLQIKSKQSSLSPL